MRKAVDRPTVRPGETSIVDPARDMDRAHMAAAHGTVKEELGSSKGVELGTC
jgi:hypothetical protein